MHEIPARPNGDLEISDPHHRMLRAFIDGKVLALRVPLSLQEGDETGIVIRRKNG